MTKYKARMVGGACVIAFPLAAAGMNFDRKIWKNGQIVYTHIQKQEETI